jgi:hypothetical protein
VWDSIVSVVTRAWGGMIQGSNPGKVRDISLFSGYQGSFPGIKQPRCKVDYSVPFGVKVKNQWSFAPLYLHGMVRDNNSLVWKKIQYSVNSDSFKYDF